MFYNLITLIYPGRSIQPRKSSWSKLLPFSIVKAIYHLSSSNLGTSNTADRSRRITLSERESIIGVDGGSNSSTERASLILQISSTALNSVDECDSGGLAERSV